MFTTVIGRNSTLGKAVEQPDCISTPAFLALSRFVL
jgi:hypothetical protein